MSLNQFLLKRILIASLLFGICMAVSPPYFGGIIPSIVKGIVAVIFFAIPTFLFWRFIFFIIERPLFAKNLPTIINYHNEKIIYSSYAVFQIEKKGIRGKLYLLENTLQFQPYNLKRLAEVFVINLTEIEKLETFKLTKYAPEGLNITHDSKTTKFILFEIPTWKKLLNNQIAKVK